MALKPFGCGRCPESFSNSQDLREHISNHLISDNSINSFDKRLHAGKPEKEPKYFETISEKEEAFIKEYFLKIHEKFHTKYVPPIGPEENVQVQSFKPKEVMKQCKILITKLDKSTLTKYGIQSLIDKSYIRQF